MATSQLMKFRWEEYLSAKSAFNGAVSNLFSLSLSELVLSSLIEDDLLLLEGYLGYLLVFYLF
jgi:hypothetical protein